MRLRIAKTDKADARIIQTYAQVENPPAWQPPQKFISESMEIHGLVELLIRQRTGLKNKHHSIKSKGESYTRTSRILNKLINQMDKEIADLESSMESLIREHQGMMYDQLCTIPGIGRKTAMFLIVVTNGFSGFENSKQIFILHGSGSNT